MANIDLSALDIKELKSMAYDQLATLEVVQANLRAINAEIAKKQQQPAPVQPQVEPQVEEAKIVEETK